jgi:hypothetical protein
MEFTMHTLKAGTTLYHGTDNSDFEEESSNPNPYSWFSTSRTVAEQFAKRSGGWGGPKRIIEYRLSEDLALPEITSTREMQAFAEEHEIDLSGVEGMRDSAEVAGIPGWIIPANYPDGDDILLGGTHLLDYVGTTLLDVPAAAPTSSDFVALADKLEACSPLLHGSAYAPVRMAEKLFRHLAKQGSQGLEEDEVEPLIQELRHFSNTVANPARERMTAAADMLESLCGAHPQQ